MCCSLIPLLPAKLGIRATIPNCWLLEWQDGGVGCTVGYTVAQRERVLEQNSTFPSGQAQLAFCLPPRMTLSLY